VGGEYNYAQSWVATSGQKWSLFFRRSRLRDGNAPILTILTLMESLACNVNHEDVMEEKKEEEECKEELMLTRKESWDVGRRRCVSECVRVYE
jgi:hypothetical protein